MEPLFRNENLKFGFGLMRLPQVDPNDWESPVDVEACKEMVDYFIDNGFTYFDTAWMYCGFQSEKATKEFLVNRHPRESFTLATKLHGGFFNDKEGMEKILKTQLDNCGVDFFDYYLLHDIGEDHYEKYTRLGCFDWIVEKKKAGVFKHIGFSYHDTADLLDKVLTEHPEMEFVQLQINYLDWDSEGIQSRKCYEVCVKHNKPVIVMEPVKGGTLANVPDEVEKLFKDYNPNMSVPSWAIRFAATQPNVKIVLSGMGNMDMVRDNVSYMKEFKPLSDEELSIVKKATDIINSSIAIPCTGCAYCVDGCPKKIAIPKYFSLYNTEKLEMEGKGFTPQAGYYNRLTTNYGKASECIGCGKCEKVCPQHLHIRENLKLVAKQFES